MCTGEQDAAGSGGVLSVMNKLCDIRLACRLKHWLISDPAFLAASEASLILMMLSEKPEQKNLNGLCKHFVFHFIGQIQVVVRDLLFNVTAFIL